MTTTLLHQCKTFLKLAQANPKATAILNTKAAIQREISAAINAVNRAINSNPPEVSRNNLTVIDDALGKMIDEANAITPETALTTADTLKGYLAWALFRTSPQQAGMGFDPITRQGGTMSVGAAIDRLNVLVMKLNQLAK